MRDDDKYSMADNDIGEIEMSLAEIAFHKGNERPPLFVKPMKASEACKQITDFTKTWPEPFAPSYAYANPWATKKDNKGKKDRPAGPMKPGFAKNGEVTL